ncbi:YxeA family protein [Lactococcus lactis]|uniref:YxeA family protein n=1 Tax=Lactococcus lactis TaxID=1358 RepID=UPI00223C45F7|nr:YxeA family protein [Lactococcus lactis]MCT0449083.1 YxeA family protein [Lactococcus lactis subsp. lactis]
MKKMLIFIVVAILIITGGVWVKGYYNNRYVSSRTYYTQIPLNEDNKTSWLVDSNGKKQEKGKEYNLKGYDENGIEKDVYFTQKGTSKDYFNPGTFIKIKSSKTLDLGIEIIAKNEVPVKALKNIEKSGT